MAIKINLRNDIQIVEIEGKMTSEEEAALRIRLDEKIRDGRTSFLFDVSRFDLSDPTSQNQIRIILKYLLTREVFLAAFGLKHNLFSKLVIDPPPDVPKFETETEGQNFITQAIKAKTDGKAPKEKKEKTEEELRTEAIQEKLKKYELHFLEKETDPYLIGKLLEEFKKTPSLHLVHAVRGANKDLKKLVSDIHEKEAQLQSLATPLLNQLKYRKAPITDAELASKRGRLDGQFGEVQKEIKQLSTDIEKNKKLAIEFKAKTDALYKNLQMQVKNLSDAVARQNTANETFAREVDIRDRAETDILIRLRQGAS